MIHCPEWNVTGYSADLSNVHLIMNNNMAALIPNLQITLVSLLLSVVNTCANTVLSNEQPPRRVVLP
jgi:hypothetical protein